MTCTFRAPRCHLCLSLSLSLGFCISAQAERDEFARARDEVEARRASRCARGVGV